MLNVLCFVVSLLPFDVAERCQEATAGIATPIAIALGDEQHFNFTAHSVNFDLNADGLPDQMPWLAKGFAFIALDLNHNGSIDHAGELFGDATVLVGKHRVARHGYSALSQYDQDADAALTQNDAIFNKLLVWHDANEDAKSEPSELSSLASLRIVALELKYRSHPSGYERLPAPLMLSHYLVAGKGNKPMRRLMGDVYFRFLTPK